MYQIITIILCAYLIGAIPTGYLFARHCFGIDITQHGSGNIGATNIARVLKKRWYFFLIMGFDFCKAYLTLLAAEWLVLLRGMPHALLVLCGVAIAVLVGNGYSIFLKFRGGKGVATGAGVLYYFIPLSLFAWYLSVWFILMVLYHRVDVASLGAVSVGAIVASMLYQFHVVIYVLLIGIAAWLWWRHRVNVVHMCRTGSLRNG